MTQNSPERCTVVGRASAAWIPVVLAMLALLLTAPVSAQVSFDQPPIDYFSDTSAYLSGHSDVVALMVLEHQTSMHNLITKANFVTRIALRDQQVINEMLGRPIDYQSESTNRRIQSVVERLVRHLLFADEIVLTDTITGTSDFAREFTSGGARDQSGRSLRQFDLQRRLFKYPCSYLIYSEAFDKLPKLAQDGVYRRLWDALTEEDTSDAFRHLSREDRQAILEILRDTKPGLPEYWRSDA